MPDGCRFPYLSGTSKQHGFMSGTCCPLYGRTYFEHSGYQDRGAVYGMGEGVLDQPVPGTYYNGLLGVSIIPYIAKTQDDLDAIRDVPSIDSQIDSSSAPIYNLQGQRLGTPQRGVNIVGGKKIIVK